MKKCEEIMTKNPECCLVGDKVYKVAQRMQSEDIGSLPVIENLETKKLVGIITDRDLALRVLGVSRNSTDTSVGEVMTTRPQSCRASDDIESTLERMSAHQIRRIPVVDDGGRVSGIISQADIATRYENAYESAKMLEQISMHD